MKKRELSILEAKEVLAPYLPYTIKMKYEIVETHNCLALVRYNDVSWAYICGEVIDNIIHFKHIIPQLTPLNKLHHYTNREWLNEFGCFVMGESINFLIRHIKEGNVPHHLMKELIKRGFDVFEVSDGFKIV